MEDPIYLDTRLLRNQVSTLQDERKTAQRLRESVLTAKSLSDLAMYPYYNRMLNEINELIQYFGKMGEALESLEQNAFSLQKSIKSLVQAETDRAADTVNKTFFQ